MEWFSEEGPGGLARAFRIYRQMRADAEKHGLKSRGFCYQATQQSKKAHVKNEWAGGR